MFCPLGTGIMFAQRVIWGNRWVRVGVLSHKDIFGAVSLVHWWKLLVTLMMCGWSLPPRVKVSLPITFSFVCPVCAEFLRQTCLLTKCRLAYFILLRAVDTLWKAELTDQGCLCQARISCTPTECMLHMHKLSSVHLLSVCHEYINCLLHTYWVSFSLLFFYSIHFIDSKILPETLAF